MRSVWPRGGGVYVVNIAGIPCYVGYTADFASRFNKHKWSLTHGKSSNKALQEAFDAHQPLSFKVLEELTGCSWRVSSGIERAWILWLRNTQNLTNVEHVTKGRGGLELKVGPKPDTGPETNDA